MPKYRITMTVVIEAPSLSDAAKALSLDDLEFEPDDENVTTTHVDLQIGVIDE